MANTQCARVTPLSREARGDLLRLSVFVLLRNKPATTLELATALHTTSSAVQCQIRQLIKFGVVVRHPTIHKPRPVYLLKTIGADLSSLTPQL